MTRAREIHIDRLVLPASERHRAADIHAALKRSLAVELGGAPDAGHAGHPLADRAAHAVADRVKRQLP